MVADEFTLKKFRQAILNLIPIFPRKHMSKTKPNDVSASGFVTFKLLQHFMHGALQLFRQSIHCSQQTNTTCHVNITNNYHVYYLLLLPPHLRDVDFSYSLFWWSLKTFFFG